MKSLITAILLALTTSALASPRHPTPAQWRDIRAFESLYGRCGGADDPANQPEHLTKACVAASKLQKTLTAQGFCVYGHGEVGRAGGTHCYLLRRSRAATPAQKWFLEVTIYGRDNRGGLNGTTIMHLEHAFDTRSECLARWRVFREQCGGLIPDQNIGYASIAKFTGACWQRRQQPQPVLVPPDSDGPEFDSPGIKEEIECAK